MKVCTFEASLLWPNTVYIKTVIFDFDLINPNQFRMTSILYLDTNSNMDRYSIGISSHNLVQNSEWLHKPIWKLIIFDANKKLPSTALHNFNTEIAFLVSIGQMTRTKSYFRIFLIVIQTVGYDVEQLQGTNPRWHNIYSTWPNY